jgi:catechol O-methyltransferase
MLREIDEFCRKTPLMNIGEHKCLILRDVLETYRPKSILELGCYFGYSSLFMAHHSHAQVITFDPDYEVA